MWLSTSGRVSTIASVDDLCEMVFQGGVVVFVQNRDNVKYRINRLCLATSESFMGMDREGMVSCVLLHHLWRKSRNYIGIDL